MFALVFFLSDEYHSLLSKTRLHNQYVTKIIRVNEIIHSFKPKTAKQFSFKWSLDSKGATNFLHSGHSCSGF